MIQKILLAIVFAAALIYLGRYIYRQVKAGDKDGACDKCLPKDVIKKSRNHD
ncbi:MAG: hypothetical protein HC819_06880 [Cyclobacteriaceae bacterium]|nr:hypothetical protein [Cyclobacteriaceae bacterium]